MDQAGLSGHFWAVWSGNEVLDRGHSHRAEVGSESTRGRTPRVSCVAVLYTHEAGCETGLDPTPDGPRSLILPKGNA